MKLYFMKQTALDYMKTNISSLYKNYYSYDTNVWIEELFDYDPFEFFMEVPDFELSNLNLTPGEIELNNCKIMYTNLKKLSESQACDERLWAGLCNKTFYTYMHKRWKYGRKHMKKTSDDSQTILLRYFYGHSGRSGMFRNTLSRSWWVGRMTYSEKYKNPWELLDAIGAEDIISKVSDIFYSNTYSANPAIIEGFCQGLKFYRDHDKYVSCRYHIRPTAQYLNALGGAVLLDMFSAEDIKNIVIEHIAELMKEKDISIVTDDSDEELIETDDEDEDGEEVAVDYDELMESLEQTEELDLNDILGELQFVEYGCKVHILKVGTNSYFVSTIPLKGQKLNFLQERALGKAIGEIVKIGKDLYEIIDIRRA